MMVRVELENCLHLLQVLPRMLESGSTRCVHTGTGLSLTEPFAVQSKGNQKKLRRVKYYRKIITDKLFA